MNTKDISDKEVLEMLNCDCCLLVIEALREKIKDYGNTLYEAYDSVANKYYIGFGFAYIDIQKSKFCPYVIIDKDRRELDMFKKKADAQKEILHQTMYELAHRIENGKKNIRK